MSNVYGRLLSDPPMKPLEVQLTTSTSVETRLSLDGTASLQNQTHDPKKVMTIKIPSSSGDIVLPFNQALYGSPLAFVADMPLPNELSTSVHKSLAVQFSYTEAKPIAAGAVFVLGDSLKLEAETATDPKSSTYTMNLLLPTAAVSVTSYTITMVKNTSLNVFISKIFNWNSLDTPDDILTKWHATMRPTIDSTSFGHCSIRFDVISGKFSAVIDLDPSYGTFSAVIDLDPAYGTFSAVIDLDPSYGTFTGNAYFNRNVGTDPSKNSIGLKPTNDAFNPTWYSNMCPVPFENVAQVAYFRGGIKKDGQNRIVAELLVTGTNSTTPYQRRYDITRFVDEQNTVRMPYNPSLKYTLFINSSNENVFFAGVHEVKQILNNGLLMTTYA
ncbi:hypothetical protein T492DRAFT_844023 [Pavlovales sp. CCMP2436]|nr:hypothetical protein T492DRAFT_844023 [Pavlovales sp. CCMP2436]